MTGSTGVIAWAWLLLTADPTVASLVLETLPDNKSRIGVYQSGMVPEDVHSDYIVLQRQSYREVGNNIQGERGAASMLLTVRAVSKSAGYARAEAIMQAVDAVLNLASGTAGGITVKSCIPEVEIGYPEVKEGVTYAHQGIMYRVFVSKS